MKICQVCAVDFTLQKFLIPLVQRLTREGWDVIAVCSYGDYIPRLQKDGMKIEPLQIDRSMNPFKLVCAIWRLYCFFKREKFDIVHVHTPVAALAGRLAAFVARVPFVVYTAHGFYFHEDMSPPKKRVHMGIEKVMGHFTDLLFTQSQEDAQTARENAFLPIDRIFAIGNGVDVGKFSGPFEDLRSELGIDKKMTVIGMIGRLVSEKGVVEFFEAAIEVAKTHPQTAFMLVGERLESDHAIAVDKAIERAKAILGDRLYFLGLREDVPRVLSSMDIFCLPSWREGMPRTIIEAMMSGRPVIATDIRGSREEVVQGETGLLVPVRNVKKLVEAMTTLVDSPDKAQSMGRAGRERALELYDEQRVVSLQIELLKRFQPKSNGSHEQSNS